MSENAQYRWVWVIGSFVTFAFIIFLYYLATLMPEALDPESENGNLAPQFTFYNDLPNRQASSARHAIEKHPAEHTAQTPEAYQNNTHQKLGYTKPQEIILQAGSYKLWQDADRRRAELALLGLESRVSKVKLNDGTTWYRIELGPFPSGEALDHARNMLTINGVEFYQKKARG